MKVEPMDEVLLRVLLEALHARLRRIESQLGELAAAQGIEWLREESK